MLIKPLITEKSTAETARNRYTFRVQPHATKTQIKFQVEKLFGVNVKKIQTVSVHGKTYRTGRRWLRAARPDWKKAVVTLIPGQKIALFDVNTGK